MKLGAEFRSRLVLTTAMIACVAGYGRRAYALCIGTAPNFICTGTNTTPFTFSGAGTTVNIEPGFIASTPTGILPRSTITMTGDGALSFTQATGSSITSGAFGFGGGYGLNMRATTLAGAISIQTAAGSSIDGGYVGIRSVNEGSNPTTITVNGDIGGPLIRTNGTRGIGVYATSLGAGNLDITNNGTITGARYGIAAYQYQSYASGAIFVQNGATGVIRGGLDGMAAAGFPNAGAISMVNNGRIYGARYALSAYQKSNSGINILSAANSLVTDGYVGIRAFNKGSGAMTITVNGEVAAPNLRPADGLRGIGVYATSEGAGAITITNNSKVTGARYGIFANQRGSGAVTVTSLPGTTTTGSRNGLSAVGYGNAGAISITAAGTISGSRYGVYANQQSNAGLTIYTGPDSAISGNYVGVRAYNLGNGAANITVNGNIGSPFLATTGFRGIGVFATNKGSNTVSVTSNATINGARYGIFVYQFGAGALSVTVNGDVTGGSAGFGADGIQTYSNGLVPAVITVTSGHTVQGTRSAIRAVSKAGTPTQISNAGILRNVTGLTADPVILSGGGPVTFINDGTVIGSATLGNGFPGFFAPAAAPDAYASLMTNNGLWNTAGGINDFGGNSASTLINNGRIIAAGGSGPVQTIFAGVNSFINSGLLTMQNRIPGDRTIVRGNFIGSNSTIELDTVLGGSDSLSDRFVIDGGRASGLTYLNILNAGGMGALTSGNGIMIVEALNGATTLPDAFRLRDSVIAGAYEYTLFYGGVGSDVGNQSWYLRSRSTANPADQTPLVSPSVQTALPYTSILGGFADATLGTFQQRNGNRIWPGALVPAGASGRRGEPVLIGQGAWGRIGGRYASFDPAGWGRGSPYTLSVGFIQAGYEGVVYETATGIVTTGLYAMIGTAKADIGLTPNPVTGAARKGDITTTGYGVGMNLSWLGANGLYVDAVGQVNGYSSNLSNKAGGNNQGWSTTLSMEVGKRFELGSGWAVVPQAQLVWTHASFRPFTDIYGARVTPGDGSSLDGRVGLRVEKLDIFKGAGGIDQRLQMYGIANLTYGFLGSRSLKVSGVNFAQDQPKLWAEVGLGATYAWGKKWSAYGEASYATALSHGGSKNYALRGTAGLRYSW